MKPQDNQPESATQTIIIGHRNPDMDSICSAVSYARLKQLQGVPGVVAARAGNTNARIDFVLKKFGVEAPIFLSDVGPKVSDVMQKDPVVVRSDCCVYDALQLIAQKELRGLPVTNDKNHCMGMLSAFALSHHLFPPREHAGSARHITASLAAIVETFGGTVLTGHLSREPVDQVLMVAAMNVETFSDRLKRQNPASIVLFVGDRDDVQMRAIESGVQAIVVTGGLKILKSVQRAATEEKVAVISSPHDTATTVLLARGGVRVEGMIEPFTKFSPDTALETARISAAASPSFVFPVIDENGVLAGIIAKSDFLKPVPRHLVLVDHNEMTQAVPGADKVPIVEVLDHHRMGGFTSDTPVLVWNNPVGSTCTLVALCFEQAGIEIPKEIAGLMMAGLISDTLNLTSPTATATDKRILEKLSKIAKENPTKLAEQIFSVGSPLLTMSVEEVIGADCKQYEDGGKRFSVSQIEELNFVHLTDKQDALVEGLNDHCKRRGLCFAALLVTDVNVQNSLLLACGQPEVLDRITFPSRAPNVWELDGIVSRKKQLLPYLLHCLA